MGIFSNLLLVSDYDDTLALSAGRGGDGRISRQTRAALERFVAGGGLFTVATGRSAATFAPCAAALPINAPVIVSGGGALYDYRTERFLSLSHLPGECAADCAALCRDFPDAALEIYHADALVWLYRPNAAARLHGARTGTRFAETDCLCSVALPWHKVLLAGEPALLARMVRRFDAPPLRGRYAAVLAGGGTLLELTAPGADKGGAVRDLAQRLNIPPQRVCCVGDEDNDRSMLAEAGVAFAPADAAPCVQKMPQIRMAAACANHTLVDVIAQIETLFSAASIG